LFVYVLLDRSISGGVSKTISSGVDLMMKTTLHLLGREGGAAKGLKNTEDKKDGDHEEGRQDTHRGMEMLVTEVLMKAGKWKHVSCC
jgi:hypothetical protein